MDQRSQPRVGGRVGVDDDPLVLRVAPAARRSADRLERHGEPQRLGEGGQRLDQMRMRIAGQRLARRLQRHRLNPGQRLGLRQREHERGLEEHAPLAGLLPALVALLDRHRGKDPQRLLVLADRPAELQPGAKPGDALGHDPALVALPGESACSCPPNTGGTAPAPAPSAASHLRTAAPARRAAAARGPGGAAARARARTAGAVTSWS